MTWMFALMELLKQRTTKVGVAVAVLFQLIFGIVWMTAYDGVYDRVDRLKVGIVNEDSAIGGQIASQLQKTLPTDTAILSSIEEAQKLLNDRELSMVVRIPADFSQRLQTPEGKGAITYMINESNPSMIKSMMTGIADRITATVNKMAVGQGVQAVLTGLQVPADRAGAIAAELTEKVTGETVTVHPVQGMNHQMVPLMLVLASYVGAMIMGMNLEQSAAALRGTVGKWPLFGARMVLNAVAAVLVSLIGSGLLTLLGVEAEAGFWMLWAFEALMLLAFILVSQMFLLLFGEAGMVFNILLLSMQLVSSGALVPRDLLSDFFYDLGVILPATYAAEGGMNVLFGGPSVTHSVSGLLALAAAGLLIGTLAVALRGQRPAGAGQTTRAA
ncbi:YhgE/Pip domain-containing protein [Paenibacillus thermoaerophilus]|uniref:YhgE/Pip domain-containing protein n=1 Tax=Paenibacillus thermoaerophilus TaxID=1215385 RepID=A0ABW2V4Q3_9BACL|nr:ABC transporter permease [Paenibacillus thermoaerophilus]